MIGLAALLAVGLALAWAIVVTRIIWSLTHPPRRTYASAVSRGRPGSPAELAPARDFREWHFTSRGVRLPAWDIPGDDPAGPVAVLSHGWGDSRLGGLVRLRAVLPWASRAVLWDLPGHGEAPGRCALGTREVDDLVALVESLDAGAPVVLMGWSLGAGVSIAAADRVSAVAVIAESPYRFAATPALRVLRLRGFPVVGVLGPGLAALGVMLRVGARWDGFDRAQIARTMRAPLLVVHGELDAICPVEEGREIASAAPNGRIDVIPGGGHNDLWTDERFSAPAEASIARFIAEVVRTRAPADAP